MSRKPMRVDRCFPILKLDTYGHTSITDGQAVVDMLDKVARLER
jgi:hypothetical protein